MLELVDFQELSVSQFHEIVDSMPQLVWTSDPDGNFDFFNKQWLFYTGQTLDQARRWGWQASVHSDDIDSLVQQWQDAIVSTLPFEFEYQLRRATDGNFYRHVLRAVPVKNPIGQVEYWIGISIDVEKLGRRLDEKTELLALSVDAYSVQQTVLRDALYSVSENKLTLCASELDLPIHSHDPIAVLEFGDQASGKFADYFDESLASALARFDGFGALIDCLVAYCEELLYRSHGGVIRIYPGLNMVQVWIEDIGGRAEKISDETKIMIPLRDSRLKPLLDQSARGWLMSEPDGTTLVLDVEFGAV